MRLDDFQDDHVVTLRGGAYFSIFGQAFHVAETRTYTIAEVKAAVRSHFPDIEERARQHELHMKLKAEALARIRRRQEIEAEKRRARKAKGPKPTELPREERNAEIVQLRESGMTLRAIGRRFGIGPERVRQVLAKAERLARTRERIAQEKAEGERRIAAAQAEAKAKAAARRRMKHVYPVRGVTPALDGRTPEDEWLAIQEGR
jgi:hypothetical protein